MKRGIFALAFLLGPYELGAQTISAADLKAQIDQKVAGLNEFQLLLNDPDPVRAREAMKIMLASKDPDLERMALEFGIFSPDQTVRRMALEAFLLTGPALRVSLDGRGATDAEDFATQIRNASGTTDADGMGFLNLVVGQFNADEKCYKWLVNGRCLIRLTDAGQAIQLWGAWWNLELGNDGVLTGKGDMPNGNLGVGVSIPVTQ